MKKKQFPSDLLRSDREHLNQDKTIRQAMLEMWAELSDARYDSSLLKSLVLRYAEAEKRIRNLHEQLQEDLASASVIQKTLLPAAMPESDIMEAAWKFQPCDAVGGDIIALEALDKDHWGCYVLDVAGHGPRAAMVTVSVAQFLKPSSGIDLYNPVRVMDALEKEFPFTRFGSFFTIIYGVVDLKKQSFSFCNAGHPFPALATPGGAAEFVEVNDHMLGLGFNEPRNLVTLDLSSGRSLLLYSDGLTECVAPDGSFYGEDRLLRTFSANCRLPVNEGAEAMFNDAVTFASGIKFKDDFTLLTLKTRI
ncbi:MAG: serine/threonine-protein phosphatase [Candidatus Riflebacteria bacterium]|nr:serine/threonine-protein phosphatase [Candidatus Riflebacteria bacterium]